MISDPKASKYLNIIHNSSLHLQNVVEDALDLSRIENFMQNFISFNKRSNDTNLMGLT